MLPGSAVGPSVHVERESAEKISAPALREPVNKRAHRAAALAEKFEAARKKG
jgi:hypothetical protein